jgi:O-antigen/teichoic acid export membrane protein
MDMGRLSMLELAGHAISVVLTIVLAMHYPTAWVLVGMSVFSTALRCAGTYLVLHGPPSRWHYDPAVARETWQFGRWILASSGMTFLATHGDRMLLAALTTPAVLGQFAIARNLSGMPSTFIAALIGSVGYSTLCEIARERPAELNHHFARVQRKVDLVCMGCAGLMLPAGPLIVAVLFDDRYLDAGWMVSLMSLALLMQRFLLVDQLALALGDSAWLARKQAVAVAALFGGIVLGHWAGGVTGAVIGATVSPLAVLPMAMLRMRRLGVLSLGVEARAWAALVAGVGLSLLADRGVRAAAAALGHPLP